MWIEGAILEWNFNGKPNRYRALREGKLMVISADREYGHVFTSDHRESVKRDLKSGKARWITFRHYSQQL